MLTIDDAAILNHAKELCERSGIAWNLLSKTSRNMRVLTDGGRRECLMRARNELVRAAEELEAIQTAPFTSQATGQNEVTTKEMASPPSHAAMAAPARRVA